MSEAKHPYKIGANYLIRTVTMIYTGKLEEVYPGEFVITQAAWIAETARWKDCVEKGEFKEVEPYPADARVIVGRGANVDAVDVKWDLPREQLPAKK